MRKIVFIVFASVLMLSSGLAAQQRDEREALQRFRERWDPSVLRPDISFRDARGRTRTAVRCATRPTAPGETDEVASFLASLPDVDLTEPEQRAGRRINVVFHVIRKKNGRFDVPDAQILEQIDHLNRAFRGRGFRFRLRQVIRHDSNRFAARCQSTEAEFKSRYAVDPSKNLNIYTCRPKSFLGWTWFPDDWPQGHSMHGITVLYSTLPGGTAVPFDEGDTVVHEVGHYLGLYHTFQGGCGGVGDRVRDTAPQSSPTFGCPRRRDSCPAEGGDDPIHNFMDYSDDVCMTEFTPGQRRFMKQRAAASRTELLR